ncbi:MAG: exodeoxyribonuclease VII small subunit [Oscillospiraceae bacterium]|nr:exodeoxyribonuclease VII small subunit [Oscillospiraceae bacterium]
MKKEMTLEQAMKRLEEITEKMQSESVTLDKSLKLFEEGSSLVAFCNEKLQQAQLKITQLTSDGEEEKVIE